MNKQENTWTCNLLTSIFYFFYFVFKSLLCKNLLKTCDCVWQWAEMPQALKKSKAINPFLNDILDSHKLKEFAEDNFKFDKNGKKFFKRVENHEGKAEIAHYEQFLLFPTEFSKDLFCKHIKTRNCLENG